MNEGSVATRYLVKRPVSFFLTFFLAHLSTFYWEKLWTSWAKGWLARRKLHAASSLEDIPKPSP